MPGEVGIFFCQAMCAMCIGFSIPVFVVPFTNDKNFHHVHTLELPVAAANDRYVLRIARCCWLMSSNNAELKLGQNIHKNMLPTIANRSDI